MADWYHPPSIKKSWIHYWNCTDRKSPLLQAQLSNANYYQRFFDLNTNNVPQTWRGISQENKRKFVDSFLPNQNEVSTSHPKEITMLIMIFS